MFGWNNKAKKTRMMEKKIAELQAQRQGIKDRIRKLKTEMDVIISQAAKADELDRKIYALDYEAKSNELKVENQHFNDISRLIAQMQKVLLTQEKQSVQDSVISVSNGIETEALLQEEDLMNAKRALMDESSDALEDALSDVFRDTPEMPENEEFTRLLSEAKFQKALKQTEEVLPPREAAAAVNA